MITGFSHVSIAVPDLDVASRRLAEIMTELAAIDRVKIIRIHTRVPVADPTRVSPESHAGKQQHPVEHC